MDNLLDGIEMDGDGLAVLQVGFQCYRSFYINRDRQYGGRCGFEILIDTLHPILIRSTGPVSIV